MSTQCSRTSCNLYIESNHNCICCDCCNCWTHLKCVKSILSDILVCLILGIAIPAHQVFFHLVPLITISINLLIIIFNNDLIDNDDFDNEPEPDLDPDNPFQDRINSQYYSIQQFSDTYHSDGFSFLHLNIRSLQINFDNC